MRWIWIWSVFFNPISTGGGVKTTQRFLEAHLLKKFSTEPYPKPLCKIMKNALLFDKKRKKFLFYFLVCFLALCRFHPPSVIIVSFCFFSVIRLCMGEMNIKFVACPHTRCLAISYHSIIATEIRYFSYLRLS